MGTAIRWLGRAGIALSLLLSALVVFQWHRSKTNFTTVRLGKSWVMMADGKACWTNHLLIGPSPKGLVRSVPLDNSPTSTMTPRWSSFHFSRYPIKGTKAMNVALPLWLPALLLAVPPTAWTLRRAAFGRGPGGRDSSPVTP